MTTTATCPECLRPIRLERGSWTCHNCCLAWIERPDDAAGRRCCCGDGHGRNCEPPSELCCRFCTEAHHPDHADGSRCSNRDLSSSTYPPRPLTPEPLHGAAAAS